MPQAERDAPQADAPLTRNDVAGIADYARIALTPEELDQMTAYLNDAVALLKPIRHFCLEGVEPTFHPIGGLANVMAPDEPDPARSLPTEVALSAAASSMGRFFRIPSILGAAEDAPADSDPTATPGGAMSDGGATGEVGR